MPDEGTSTDAGNGAGNAGGDAPKTFTQDQVNDLLARQKGDVQRKYSDYDDLKKKADELAQLRTAGQSDLERLTGERDSLTGKLTGLTAQNMRLQVALEKGLVGDKAALADRLSGDTLEAMKADADELLKLFGGTGSGFDGGARSGADAPKDMNQMIRHAAGR